VGTTEVEHYPAQAPPSLGHFIAGYELHRTHSHVYSPGACAQNFPGDHAGWSLRICTRWLWTGLRKALVNDGGRILASHRGSNHVSAAITA
jgi:hypothetical protein